MSQNHQSESTMQTDLMSTLFLFLLVLAALAGLQWLQGKLKSSLMRAREAIERGDYFEAKLHAEKALQNARTDLNKALAFDELGAVHRFMGEHPEAERCYRQALELREQHLPAEHGDIGVSLHNLALGLLINHKFEEAETCNREALAKLPGAYGDRHPQVLLTLGCLGQACLFTGKLDEATELIDESLELTKEVCGFEHRLTAEALLRRALCAAVRGLASPADLAYRACRDVNLLVFGPEHPFTLIVELQHASLLTGWHRLSGDTKALTEADWLATEAVKKLKATLGPDHQFTGDGLRTLAQVRRLQQQPIQAVYLGRESVRVIEGVLGPDDLRTAFYRLVLAHALADAGELDEAQEHATRARPVYEEKYGANHFEVGDVYELLGHLAVKRRDFTGAEEYLARSLELRAPLGPTHPLRAFTLREQAELLRQSGRGLEAITIENQAKDIVAHSERQKLLDAERDPIRLYLEWSNSKSIQAKKNEFSRRRERR